MHNILVISAQSENYNTSSMIRIRTIVNHLAEKGCNIDFITIPTIKTSKYYTPNMTYHANIQFHKFGFTQGGYSLLELSSSDSFKYRLLRLLRIIYKKIDIFGSSITILRSNDEICDFAGRKDYDYLISFSDPKTSHLVSNIVFKRLKRKPFYIQQWGDPLLLDMTLKTLIPKFLLKYIEGQLLKPAQKIIYVSPITHSEQMKIFRKKANKMFFIPTPTSKAIYGSKKKDSCDLRLGYFGSYNTIARDIRPLYQSVLSIPSIQLSIIGDSDVAMRETINITVRDRIDSIALSDEIAACDILVCVLNKDGTQIPGKIYNYAGTDKEVLIILDGRYGEEIHNYFTRFNRYTFCTNRIDCISEALKAYIRNGIPKREPLNNFLVSGVVAEILQLGCY